MTSPAPPPVGDIERALMSTGLPVDISRATPADYDEVRSFYEHLDDDSTYFRFFGIRRQLPERELREVVGATAEHVTMLARVGERLIGIGEYILGTDRDEAEVAFAVADDHHREGVATLLLERLAVIGHDRGLARFRASVLADNGDMQLVFRTVGLIETTRFDGNIVEVTLDLSSVVGLLAAAARRVPHQSIG